MKQCSNILLCIGVPCSFPFVPVSFFYSYVLMEKPSHIFIHADNGGIEALRNDIVTEAQRQEATHLLMCDTDQVYPVDTITRLLSHRLPVVGAKVNRRYPPFDPIMMKLTDAGYVSIEDYAPGDLVEVDATGAGCILFDMQIFKDMPEPWFRFRKHPQTGLVIGEDIGFCQDLKAKGYKIYVDTAVEVGHLSTFIVNQRLHELYKAMHTDRARESLTPDIVRSGQTKITQQD